MQLKKFVKVMPFALALGISSTVAVAAQPPTPRDAQRSHGPVTKTGRSRNCSRALRSRCRWT